MNVFEILKTTFVIALTWLFTSLAVMGAWNVGLARIWPGVFPVIDVAAAFGITAITAVGASWISSFWSSTSRVQLALPKDRNGHKQTDHKK